MQPGSLPPQEKKYLYLGRKSNKPKKYPQLFLDRAPGYQVTSAVDRYESKKSQITGLSLELLSRKKTGRL